MIQNDPWVGVGQDSRDLDTVLGWFAYGSRFVCCCPCDLTKIATSICFIIKFYDYILISCIFLTYYMLGLLPSHIIVQFF